MAAAGGAALQSVAAKGGPRWDGSWGLRHSGGSQGLCWRGWQPMGLHRDGVAAESCTATEWLLRAALLWLQPNLSCNRVAAEKAAFAECDSKGLRHTIMAAEGCPAKGGSHGLHRNGVAAEGCLAGVSAAGPRCTGGS